MLRRNGRPEPAGLTKAAIVAAAGVGANEGDDFAVAVGVPIGTSALGGIALGQANAPALATQDLERVSLAV